MRFAAAAVVLALPEVDVSHVVPHEPRFDLLAFACSAGPLSSPVVLNTPTQAPSATPSAGCALVQNRNILLSWRTQVIAKGDTASELVSLRGARVCFMCGLHRSGTGACCGLPPHSVGHVACGARGWSTIPLPSPFLPAAAASDLHALCHVAVLRVGILDCWCRSGEEPA